MPPPTNAQLMYYQDQIAPIFDNKTEEELFSALAICIPKFDGNELGDSVNDLEDAVTEFSDTPSFPTITRTNEGKAWWEKFWAGIKHEFCSNETIRKFFTQDVTDNAAISAIVALVATALALAIQPWILIAVAIIVAIILKVGYQQVCDI